MSVDENNIENLFKQARLGNQSSFDELYNLYLTPVYRYIFLKTGHKQTTEDICQIVFIKAYENINKLKSYEKPLAWFFTIARNAVIDHYRNRSNKETLEFKPETLEIPSFFSPPEKEIDRNITIKKLADALAQLPSDQNEVMVLKFLKDLNHREIAEILEKSPEAVRQLQCRAIKNLKNKAQILGIRA